MDKPDTAAQKTLEEALRDFDTYFHSLGIPQDRIDYYNQLEVVNLTELREKAASPKKTA